MITATYNDSVFINCPFDKEYGKFFHALVFTIYRCGFLPRCAKEIDDAMTSRIDKILKIIEKCKYGIHDISRVNIDRNEFSKLNMPFELGLFWGASKLGNAKQKEKIATIIVGNEYDLGKYFSDLNGVHIKKYKNNEIKLIIETRNWLLKSSRSRTIPGHYTLIKDFKKFYKALPHICNKLGLHLNLDFIDLSIIIEEWLGLT